MKSERAKERMEEPKRHTDRKEKVQLDCVPGSVHVALGIANQGLLPPFIPPCVFI